MMQLSRKALVVSSMLASFHFVTLIIASALTISIVTITQKAQAQNTSPQPMDKRGAMIADAAGTRTNNLPTSGSGAASQKSSPIFVTEIPPDTATGG
jgi:hypothetical protein